jgi:hypothetical protein
MVLSALVISLALLATGMLIPFAESHGDLSDFVGGFLGVAIVGALFAIPVRFLPAITLLVTLLVPSEATFVPHSLKYAALGAVPLAIWMIRTPRLTQTPRVLQILAILLGIWLALSEIFAPLHSHRGWEWLLVAIVALVLPILHTPTGLDLSRFRLCLLVVASVLGIYALIEGFFLHANPLFGDLFRDTVWWSNQHFNASYRATTLLGHPLVNGTVFSAAAVLAASSLVRSRDHALGYLVCFGILTGAVLVTRSRGAAVALAVGLAVAISFERGHWQGHGIRRLILAVCAVVGLALVVVGLEARNASVQGHTSAEARVSTISYTKQTLSDIEPFGAGPGESDTYRAARQLSGSSGALENSYAELVVSLGPIGVVIILALLGSLIAIGLRVKLVIGETAALLTVVVAIAGYNAIEGHRMVIILISLLTIAILTGVRDSLGQHSRRQPGGVMA